MRIEMDSFQSIYKILYFYQCLRGPIASTSLPTFKQVKFLASLMSLKWYLIVFYFLGEKTLLA